MGTLSPASNNNNPLHRVQALQAAGEGGILSPLLPLIGEKVGDGNLWVFPPRAPRAR